MVSQPFDESSDSFCFTMRSAGFVRRRAERSGMLGLVLNRLPYAEIYGVVVVARLTERIATTLQPTVETDRRSAISGPGYSRLAPLFEKKGPFSEETHLVMGL